MMKRQGIILLLWIAAATAPAAAQDLLFETVGRYDSGEAHDVDVDEDVLFYASGSYVVAIRCTNDAYSTKSAKLTGIAFVHILSAEPRRTINRT